MPSDIEKARDEYIAAIKAHANAVATALGADSDDVNREYEPSIDGPDARTTGVPSGDENLRDLGSHRD
jgi:hypothetical protein